MSTTKTSQIARRYAKALFSASLPADRREMAQEFKQVLAVLEDPKVHDAFHHPRTSKEQKRELIRLMQLSTIMESFLSLVVEKSREAFLPAIASHFEELVLEAQQTTLAEVISAVPLNEGTIQGLKQKLSTITGKTVLLRTNVDPTIGGGMIIKVDGKVIDGSVTHTLQQFQRSLVN